MKLKEITNYLDEIVPLSLQESYDNSGLLLNSTGVFNHPATTTNWNFGSSILEQQSGQIVNVHITFMSSLGMIVIDENVSIPE